MKFLLKIIFALSLFGVAPVWAAPPTAALDVSAILGNVGPENWNAIIGRAPLTVDFDASGSSDDGTIELYMLNHGIGATNGVPYLPDELLQEGSDPEMSYTYTMPGTYNNVAVRVQDNDGEWSTDSFPPWSIIVTEPLEPSCPGGTPPTAALDVSPIIGEAPLTVEFDASGSSDDGMIELYKFYHGHGNGTGESGPYTIVLDEPFQEKPTPKASYIYTAPGYYNNLHLKVKDNDGCWSEPASAAVALSEAITITVKVPNVAPTAVLEADPEQGEASLKVVFDASGSSDDGTIQKYIYFFGNADAEVVTEPGYYTYIYDTPGTYNAYLQVQDNDGAWSDYSLPVPITVTGPNVPPTAVLDIYLGPPTGDQSTPLTVEFDGIGSDDVDGDVAVYAFNFDDGSPLEVIGKSDTVHVYTTPGTYHARLRVQDNDGAWSNWSDPMSFSATGNFPPTAVLIPDPPAGEAYLTVEFNASGSYDPDGTIQKYIFDYGDAEGTVTGEPVATHMYKTPGTYTATLSVIDDDQVLSASDPFPETAKATITVFSDTIWGPTAVLHADPEHGEATLEVLFDGSESSDYDGEVVEYQFHYGDGNSSEWTMDSVITYEYPDPGIYPTSLIVKDDDGAISSFPPLEAAKRTITVTEPPSIPVVQLLSNIPPTAVLIPTGPTTGEAPLIAAFNGSGSYDVDGTVKYYTFGIEGAPTLESIVESSITQIFNEPGNYTVTLKVQDNDGAWSVPPHPAVTITVKDEPKKGTEKSVEKAAAKKAAEEKAAQQKAKKAAEEKVAKEKAAQQKAKKAEEKQKAEEQRQAELKRQAAEREKKAAEEKARKDEANQRAWKSKIAANYTRARHEEMKALARRYGILSWFESKYPDPGQD